MLRADVVDAVKAGRFHIYAVGTIDEGIEVLTGIAAGSRHPDGTYPVGSVHDRVQKKLQLFTERQRQLNAPENQQNSEPERDE
jgi:hypothetical protein